MSKGPPPEIYLQWYVEDEDNIYGDTTWCQDKINNSDVKYIRHDLAVFYDADVADAERRNDHCMKPGD